MTFLLDVVRKGGGGFGGSGGFDGCVSKISHVERPSLSFLDFIKVERNRVALESSQRLEVEQERTRLKAQYEDLMRGQYSISKRNQLKQSMLELDARISAQSSLTIQEFDRNVLPFLDLFYKRAECNITEEQLVSTFTSEMFPRTVVPQVHSINLDTCNVCGSELISSAEDATLYCAGCGDSTRFIDATASNIAYGDEIEYTSFSYKRINHLNEFLNHFQAKESTPVPDEVIHKIMAYFFEKRVHDKNTITFDQVKKTQKILGLRRYYDQTMQIWCRITGKQPLRLDPVVEEKLRLLFIRIQIPFKKHCPVSRSNFLSYPYVIFKFCQMLKYHNLLPYLSLLKGKDKLRLQEEIFEKICDELGWKFIPI